MTPITEDYVSDEIFKLLKEKGFDDSCCRFVVESDETYHRGAPTLQMAMKWLREVHKLHIEPHIQSYKKYNGNIYNLDGELLLGFTGESPEQACEAAIKYCLEYLI